MPIRTWELPFIFHGLSSSAGLLVVGFHRVIPLAEPIQAMGLTLYEDRVKNMYITSVAIVYLNSTSIWGIQLLGMSPFISLSLETKFFCLPCTN